MIKPIRIALWAPAVAALSWYSLQAANPEPLLPTTGHVLILVNGRILEGDIERAGDHYRVKYPVGETLVPADQVKRLCADMPSTYTFLRGQTNQDDPDEHLRLARWCQIHGLLKEALAEITQAVDLRPSHAESRHLLKSLQETEPATVARPHPEPEAEPGPPQAIEYNTASLGLFVTRVQPILMNACANCHASGRGGQTFRLIRAYEGELTNRRATQQNLAAVLAHVNRKQPETSVLLSRAVTVHGDATQAPLKSREAPAFKSLEEWVQRAMANEPRESQPAAPAVVPESKVVPELPTPRPPASTAPAPPTPSTAFHSPEPRAAPAPASQPDPYDPMLFNQQAAPQEASHSAPSAR